MNNKIILEYLAEYAKKLDTANKVLAELWEKLKHEDKNQNAN